MVTRRDMLKTSAKLGAVLAWPYSLPAGLAEESAGLVVNDIQSRLNPTTVHQIVQPRTVDEIAAALLAAERQGRAVSVAGGRHAMGGQQFGSDTLLLDMDTLNQVIDFDREKGRITVEAGIQWPELIEYLQRAQTGQDQAWAIREKQTGVDRVSLGGSLAANIHGRGLRHPPIISDVESFQLLDAQGKLHTCSRAENAERFSLAIGGYGLLGIITQVTLRLVRRTKLQRVVEVIKVRDLLDMVEQRLEQGFLYGDCQYATDLGTDADSHPGVFSCYRPVPSDTPIPERQQKLTGDQWAALYKLARTDKKKAFAVYSAYYLATTGQVYWSDTHQLAGTFTDHRKAVDQVRGTEVITEIYVPKQNFLALMTQARQDFIDHDVDMTYGTIRFIEADTESFLPWAKEASVCIICNLHVLHTEAGKQKAAADFRRIIDRAIQFGGRYYLTYHRYATRRQVETCYPQFVDFLRLKKKYDPQERFQSDWYRHYRKMFADRV